MISIILKKKLVKMVKFCIKGLDNYEYNVQFVSLQ